MSPSAQTAYAELAERTHGAELSGALAGTSRPFHKKTRRNGADYWYFTYREPGVERPRLFCMGPDSEAICSFVEGLKSAHGSSPLVPQARAAITLGGTPLAARHFRIVKPLPQYGLLRACGILIGTHGFIAIGNLLGVRWLHGTASVDVDFAPARRNVSVASPANLKIDVHGVLDSLKPGLLPNSELDGDLDAR